MENAVAEATAKAKQEVAKQESSVEFRRKQAQEQAKKLQDIAREQSTRNGMDIVESWLRDISPSILRMAERDDIARVDGLRVTVNFGKCDASSSPFSFIIQKNGNVKTQRVLHRPTIMQWAEHEQVLVDRYRQQTGEQFTASSTQDMLNEMIRMAKEIKSLRHLLNVAHNLNNDEGENEGPLPVPENIATAAPAPSQ